MEPDPDSYVSYCKEDIDMRIVPTGTWAACTCFRQYSGRDRGQLDCASFARDSGISVAEFMLWNPWLYPDCDVGLFGGLEEMGQRAVCVGVNGVLPGLTESIYMNDEI